MKGITRMSSTTKPVKYVGLFTMIAGLILLLTGGIVWGVITSELAAEKITVSADSAMLAGDDVNGPFSAFAEAEVIQKHSLAGAENMTYAELGAKITAAKNAKNDADVKKYTDMRATAQQGSFLRALLFTSVLSYGVCAFAMGMGLMLGLVGWSLTKVAGALETVPVNAKA